MTRPGQNLRSRVIRGGVVLAGGQVLGQALSFVRNMIVAGILTRGDFGIASYFALTLSVLEMLSDLAVDKLLIQAEDGDDERLQGAAQAYQFVRGVVTGIALFVCAGLIADLVQKPDTIMAFQTLALLPIIRGLAHLDTRRVQRSLRFGPYTWVYVVPQFVTAAAAWPVTVWIGNYWAILWLILGQSVLMSVLSHLLAKRRYRWAWDAVMWKRIVLFGWPLLMNGVLLLGVVHGDRLLIATFLTTDDMGVYSLGLLMAMTPMTLCAKVLGDMAFPVFSKPVAESERQERYTRLMRVYIMVGLMFAVGAVGLSDPILRGIYGEKYVGAIVVLQWLGAASAIRILRAGAILQAVARGDTATSMWSSAARLVGVPLAAIVILDGKSLGWVAACAFVGEIAAMLPLMVRLYRVHALVSLPLLPIFSLSIAVGAGVVAVGLFSQSLLVQLASTIVCGASAAIAAAVYANRLIHAESEQWTNSASSSMEALQSQEAPTST